MSDPDEVLRTMSASLKDTYDPAPPDPQWRDRPRHRALLTAGAVVGVTALFAGAWLVNGGGEGTVDVATAGPVAETTQQGGTAAARAGNSTVGDAAASAEESGAASAIFAGLPLGVSDYFGPAKLEEPADVRDVSASTVVGTLVGHEVLKDEGLMRYGYAGPQGVLRLYFEVDRVIGGYANPKEAPGRPGSNTIAVDYDYWVAESQLEAHQAALAEARGAQLLLFLRAGAVEEGSTGAYRLWEAPLGAVEVSGGELSQLSVPTLYVAADALERGAGKQSPADGHPDESPAASEEAEVPGVVGDMGDGPTALSDLYGSAADAALDGLVVAGRTYRVEAPGPIPLNG